MDRTKERAERFGSTLRERPFLPLGAALSIIGGTSQTAPDPLDVRQVIGGRSRTLREPMRFSSRTFNNILLFLSSFAPLFLALAMRFTETPLRLVSLGLAVTGIGVLWGVLAYWAGRSEITIVAASVDDRGADVGGYVAAYLMPLLVVSEPSGWDIGAYALILFVIGTVYVRSRMIQFNPVLYLMGYRLYSIVTKDGFQGYLIDREQPRVGEELRVVRRENVLLGVGKS